MKKTILLIGFMLAAFCVKAQQDTQVSQYVFNGLYINPAYAGYKDDLFIQSYYRSQWVGVTGAPKSFAVAGDGSFANGSVGLGVIITSDQIGAQSVVTGYLNYAYRIRLGENENSKLAFGLAAGMMQLGIDGSKLNAVTPGDQAVPVGSQSRLTPDANFGIYYSNENYFAGISATNILGHFILQKTESNILVPIPQPHFYLTAGALISMNDQMKFKPVILLKDDVKGPTSLDIDGFVLMNERLSIGAFYRTSVKLYQKNNLQSDLPSQNAFGGIVEFFATPNLRIGYSYDHALNALSNYNYGSHEISIGLYLDKGSSSTSKYSGSDGSRCYKF
ncbi:type IX secretion system membrane protein PorP/SprF [Mucilaginibacter jinjuensis]|uniref:Type IX secretion system membrane protein PorP/SprF n=1 Tax=Mucilaginibacter jinjuensis TaxID=1176721 RepID=A0ABY7T840_9SPHI|nr:type IX secretion system membrane protein PorP/SprF [Mucilaginibacter jinjuensis]WCT11847.1 type IX secretion system membrane protein PorP/SprF [Mucilaginibacter jinjuensis]